MLRYCGNISMLWRDLPARERVKRISEAGLGAFEFLFVSAFGLSELMVFRDEFGLEVALFNLEIGDPTLKTSCGYLAEAEREREFLESAEQALEAAARLRCGRLNVLVGRADPRASWPAQRDLVVERLRRVAPDAAQAGVTLMVEAISTLALPGYLVDYSRQALEIVDLVDHPSVRFQYDVYHMQLMEGNLISTIQGNVAKIGHVQIADVPGRHEPGTGEINYPNVLRSLEETGYSGYVGLEYLPLEPDLAWMSRLGIM